MPKVVIIGGGISGLTIAYRLRSQAPRAEITVLERAARAGGTIATECRDGYRVELGPNGFLDNKPSTGMLCHDLGLDDRLVAADEAASRNRYLFLGDGLRRLPTSLWDLLRSPLLTWRGKLGLLTEPLRRRAASPIDESVDAFARRRAGREVAEIFADALVTGIYAGDPSLLSMQACFPRIARLERQYGSVMRGLRASARAKQPPRQSSRLWSLDDGLGVLIETLAQRLAPQLVLNVRVQRLLPSQAAGQPRWALESEDRARWVADVLILACPADQQALLLEPMAPELAKEIGAIPSNRIAVVALGYRREEVPGDLNGFGYIAPQRLRRDVLGVQWCSSLFRQRAPAGHVLLRAMCGGWQRSEMLDWDDGKLLAAVRAELRLALGIEVAPRFQHIVRWPHAIPQYHRGHLERVRRIEAQAAQFPGLYLAGNAYHGVALNDCTEQAELLAQRIASDLQLCPA